VAIYLAFILFNKKGEIMLVNQMLPSFIVAKEEDSAGHFDSNSGDFLWILKQSMDWETATGGATSSEAINESFSFPVSHLSSLIFSGVN